MHANFWLAKRASDPRSVKLRSTGWPLLCSMTCTQLKMPWHLCL